jgi:hypothetical protein
MGSSCGISSPVASGMPAGLKCWPGHHLRVGASDAGDRLYPAAYTAVPAAAARTVAPVAAAITGRDRGRHFLAEVT